jgi:hypothetical protein
MSWVESLKQYNDAHVRPDDADADTSDASEAARATVKEQQVLHELRQLYLQEAKKKEQTKDTKPSSSTAASSSSSSSAIPRFYIKRTTSPPPADPATEVSEDGDPTETRGAHAIPDRTGGAAAR